MEIVSTYFLYFIIYSFMGRMMEVICKHFELKRFVNRGFLIGSICPIYGYGVLGIILLVGRNTTDLLSVFLKSILVCSILEYLTSYFMEKMFKARWWDYSKRKYNINGRICLETMIPFGFLLPLTNKNDAKLLKVIFFTFLVSLSIELLQPFNGRSSDITDIITNVIGGIIGYFFYFMFKPLIFKFLSYLK